mgnify:FL=1|jgi:hypothetical protein
MTNYQEEILRMVKEIRTTEILRKIYRVVRMMYRAEVGR